MDNTLTESSSCILLPKLTVILVMLQLKTRPVPRFSLFHPQLLSASRLCLTSLWLPTMKPMVDQNTCLMSSQPNTPLVPSATCFLPFSRPVTLHASLSKLRRPVENLLPCSPNTLNLKELLKKARNVHLRLPKKSRPQVALPAQFWKLVTTYGHNTVRGKDSLWINSLTKRRVLKLMSQDLWTFCHVLTQTVSALSFNCLSYFRVMFWLENV
mmetsp:Transcript_15793/g.24362  ORF Transcript_15793/g.24362 Transcript_15793/m.24362 type:complete len:212 (-) Transcript_15793:107-742(-)